MCDPRLLRPLGNDNQQRFLPPFLVSANWLIGALWNGWIVGTVTSMIHEEEAALIEKFGDGCRAYLQRTGLFALERGESACANEKEPN